MSDTSRLGIVYTEHSGLTATRFLASLWSYETRPYECGRRTVMRNNGSYEYWLERSDPLLNTILPGTHVSLIVNFGDIWATGRSLVTSASVPRVSVIGPFTRPRSLRIGRVVHAIGAIVPPTLTYSFFGVPASELVDQIVPLEDLWTHEDVEGLLEALVLGDNRHKVSALKAKLVERNLPSNLEPLTQVAVRLMKRHAGRVSIDDMARRHSLTRQRFARRFSGATGLRPKLFARITRFQALVRVLLSTDVSRWASMASAVGYYDQAHMINEFRTFAGSPPMVFFRPHGDIVDPGNIQLKGRPCEWVRRRQPRTDHSEYEIGA